MSTGWPFLTVSTLITRPGRHHPTLLCLTFTTHCTRVSHRYPHTHTHSHVHTLNLSCLTSASFLPLFFLSLGSFCLYSVFSLPFIFFSSLSPSYLTLLGTPLSPPLHYPGLCPLFTYSKSLLLITSTAQRTNANESFLQKQGQYL